MSKTKFICIAFGLLFQVLPASAQIPTISAVLNGADFSSRVSPGVMAIVVGTNLGPTSAVTGNPVPATTVTVTIGGRNAHVLFASATQLNLQIPTELSAGTTTVTVRTAAGTSNPFNITLATHSPALFAQGSGQNPPGIFNRTTGQIISTSNPAIPGEFLTTYANGLGPTNPAVATGAPAASSPLAVTTSPATLTIGQAEAPILFCGLAPNFVGTYQVTFSVPGGLAEGNQPVTLKIAGFTSNPVMMAVGKPIPAINRVENGASFGSSGTATAGSFLTIRGLNFGTKDKLGSFPATDLEGVSVTFDGTPAPLSDLIASQGQINLVAPSELPETGTANVQVKTPIGASANFSLRMAPAVPGIFRVQDPSLSTRSNAVAVHANTRWLLVPASMARALGLPTDCAATGINPASYCAQPATAGDNIQIYATGLGKATPDGAPSGAPLATGATAPADGNPLYLTVQKPVVTIGAVAVEVQFSGITPGLAGMYQINVQVPRGAPTGDDVPLKITMPNGLSDSATIAVR